MSKIVQTKCPGCHKLLRIPAEWLKEPIRCKHCGKVLQSKPKSKAAQTPLTAPGSVTPDSQSSKKDPRAVSSARGSDAPADLTPFGANDDGPFVRAPRTPRRSSRVKLLFLGAGL